jgi:hypothetical protein
MSSCAVHVHRLHLTHAPLIDIHPLPQGLARSQVTSLLSSPLLSCSLSCLAYSVHCVHAHASTRLRECSGCTASRTVRAMCPASSASENSRRMFLGSATPVFRNSRGCEKAQLRAGSFASLASLVLLLTGIQHGHSPPTFSILILHASLSANESRTPQDGYACSNTGMGTSTCPRVR